MPAEANLQKILIRHINFDTQNKSATSNSRMRFPGSRIAEYSCAVKPPFRDAGYRRSRDGVPQIV